MQVTQRELNITLKDINDLSVRKYYLESQLGGLKLVDEKGNREITPRRLTKKDMDSVLTGIYNYLQNEKRGA